MYQVWRYDDRRIITSFLNREKVGDIIIVEMGTENSKEEMISPIPKQEQKTDTSMRNIVLNIDEQKIYDQLLEYKTRMRAIDRAEWKVNCKGYDGWHGDMRRYREIVYEYARRELWSPNSTFASRAMCVFTNSCHHSLREDEYTKFYAFITERREEEGPIYEKACRELIIAFGQETKDLWEAEKVAEERKNEISNIHKRLAKLESRAEKMLSLMDQPPSPTS